MGDLFGLPADQDISFVTQTVNAAIGGLYSVDAAVAEAAFGGLSAIWGALENVWTWLGGVFSNLWNMITNVLRWIMHTLLPDLVRWVNEIRAKITLWLQPLIKLIKFEMAWLDMVYQNIIKPMLLLIQRLRSMLVVFRLLHIGWATSLDQWLASLENRISAAFIQARQDIGVLANWINYVIDPTGLFNLPLLLLSQLQTLPQLWAALANIPSVAIGAVDAQTQATSAASGTQANVLSEMNGRAGGATADDLSRYTDILALYQADGYSA